MEFTALVVGFKVRVGAWLPGSVYGSRVAGSEAVDKPAVCASFWVSEEGWIVVSDIVDGLKVSTSEPVEKPVVGWTVSEVTT
jgi:hypothetical protein